MKLETNLSQKLILTPQLREAIEILQMSSLDLKQKVQSELQDNPFLEEDAEATREDDTDLSPIKESAGSDMMETRFEDSSDRGYVRRSNNPSNSDFLEGVLARPKTLKDELSWQLRLSVSDEKQIAIGEMIIGNTNDDGFLAVPLEELASLMELPLREVESVLTVIQTFEPYGVAARDLKESLLIQLKFKKHADPWAARIIENYFDLLSSRKLAQIARNLGVPEKVVETSVAVIASLNPRPGQEYESREVTYVVPDVIVKKIGGKFVVMINDPWIPKVNISDFYGNLMKQTSSKNPDQKFMEEKYLSALWLIRSIEQRRQTIYKVVTSLVKFQELFFKNGIKAIAPLTLRSIAEDIEMHESTISRVTQNKYIQTPWGIFEMKYLFSSKLKSEVGADFSSRSVKEIIKDIIENEESALSDAELVSQLGKMGVQISRRTVTKYRKNLRILPSYLRKK